MMEVEIKLPVSYREKIREQLLEIGFRPKGRHRMQDIYFDNQAEQIRNGDSALRIRETVDMASGEKTAQMNFKGPKSDWFSMTRPEYEMKIESASMGQKILESLGFHGVKPFVVKTREEFQFQSVVGCLDQVEGLGDFLELETLVEGEGEKEDALEMIRAVLKLLGYSMEDTITTSYLSLLQR